MNTRVLLVITAIALPLAALGIAGIHFSHKASKLAVLEARARNIKGHPTNLQEALEHNRQLLASLNYMTQMQWNSEHEHFRALPLDLGKARDAVRIRIAALEKMTPEQWLAEKQKRQGQTAQAQPQPVQYIHNGLPVSAPPAAASATPPASAAPATAAH